MSPSGCKTAAHKALHVFCEIRRVYRADILHIVKNTVENVENMA